MFQQVLVHHIGADVPLHQGVGKVLGGLMRGPVADRSYPTFISVADFAGRRPHPHRRQPLSPATPAQPSSRSITASAVRTSLIGAGTGRPGAASSLVVRFAKGTGSYSA